MKRFPILRLRFVLSLLSGVFLLSCGSAPEPVNILCLVDFSSSVSKETLKWYGTVIKEDVISALGPSDKLIVLPIDFGSQSGSKEIFITDLGDKKFSNMFDSPTRKDDIVKRRLAAHLEKLSPAFDSSFNAAINSRDEYKHQTDIIGAVIQADKYYQKSSRNLIIVFSDMLQETENLDLPGVLNSSKDFQPVIEKIDISKLHNQDIMVITGEQPGFNSNFFNKLKKFWKLVFEKAGLNLLDFESAGRNFVPRQLELYRTQQE